MKKIIKRPLSILLSVLMLVSVFVAVPVTANAGSPGDHSGGSIVVDPITVTTGSEFATAPTAISGLVANGTDQALINEGTTSAGTAYYYMTTEDITGEQANSLFNNPSKPGSFSTEIPKGRDAGTYYIWFAIDGGSNYEDLLPYMEINNQYESHKLTVTIAAPEYYIVGIGGDWDTLKDEYKLTKNPNNDAEYMFEGLTVGANTELKVKGTNTYYYPNGTGNNFTLVDAGTYDIYFRPDGQGGEGWWYGDIYATPSAPAPTYTVTWKNGDTVLETDTDVAEGATPTYDGTTPEKAEDENYTYTFAGWSPEITAVTGDTEYTAQFTAVPKPKKLTLNVGENGKVVMDNGTFGNATDANNIVEVSAPINVADGSKIFIVDDHTANLVEGGSINIATGGEVSLYPSADNTGVITAIPDEGYICTGWYNGDTLYSSDAALSYQNISENITLTAKFALAYTVTWKNWNSDVLETDTVAADATPTYNGTTPEKAEDANNTYTFAGWSPAIAPVTEDVTYTATFTAVPKGINYGGDNYIDPKGTQAVIDENNFGLNMNSYLNMQILGIQLKNSIATEGGADGVRFVTAVNSNLLKGSNIDDYGYIVAKIDANVEKLYSNMDKFTADKFSEDENKFSCKGTSNSISGEFGQYSTETDYKYVTLSVTGTSEQSGNLIARFYVKTKDGKYHYADYINGNSETNSGMAFDLSAVEANLH